MNMIVFQVATYATPASIGFQDVFGFGLAGIAIASGLVFYLIYRKKVF